jgi:hypothetical protein
LRGGEGEDAGHGGRTRGARGGGPGA